MNSDGLEAIVSHLEDSEEQSSISSATCDGLTIQDAIHDWNQQLDRPFPPLAKPTSAFSRSRGIFGG